MRRALDPLLRLTRPGNAVTAGAAVYVGWLLAGAPAIPARATLLAAVAAIAFAAAGNARNDLSDVDIDRAAHPERPLVTGELSPRAARFFVFVLYAVALESAVLISWLAVALVLVGLVLMESYERWLKQRGLVGNLAIAALTGAPFVLGGVAWDGAIAPHRALLLVALLAALATAGREVLKDVEDVDADRGRRVTLPMRIGTRGALAVAALFLAGATLLSPLPWRVESVLAWPYVPAVALADACFVAAAVAGFSRPRVGQRLAKLGMLVALVALIVGRFA